MTAPFQDALQTLRETLHAVESGRDDMAAIVTLCRAWRSRPDLMAALPPRYGQVAEDLLSRLEAGSLFSEESCSFSQQDLLQGLHGWLDKAAQQLAQA